MKHFTKQFRLLLVAMALATSSYAQFTPGNLVVYRAGDGTNNLANTGNNVFLDEYTIAGTLVQSVPMPAAAAGSNLPFICSGTATSEGLMTQSADGKYLVLTGYGVASSAVSLTGTSSATVPRAVGVVNENEVINTSIGLSDFSTGNNPRSVASTNGTDIWVGGAAGGVRYVLTSTTSQQLSTTITNIRSTGIYNGQLYISDQSGSAIRLGTVGTGTPTTAGQTITNLPGLPTSTGSPYAFVFCDMNAGIPGVDVLYVADDAPGTIIKYSLVSGTWVSNGSVTASAIRGLAAYTYANRVYLYGTTGASSSGGGGTIYTFNDNSGYNGAISGSASSIASVSGTSKMAFRGIAFAPFTTMNVTGNPMNQSAAVCGTTTFTVAATGTAPSYQWYENGIALSNGGHYSGAGTATLTVSNIASGMNNNTYYCVVSNGTGYFPAGSMATSSTATLTVTGSCPTIGVTNNPQTICAGASYTFNGHTYSSAGTYNDTLHTACGCDSVIATMITVNPAPTVSVGSNSPICVNNTINLTSSGGTSYSWTGPNSFTSTSQNPSIASATAAAGGTYTVTVTGANGCQAQGTIAVVVNALPTVTAGSNSPVCVNNAINLTSSGGTGYAWTGPNSFSSAMQNPSIASATAAMSSTYSVTVTDANGCQAQGTTAVIVNASPTATAGSNSPVCENDDINLSASGGITYLWNGPGGFSTNAQNPALTSATTAMSGTYSVTVTDANGCQAQGTTAVVVNALPIVTAGSNSPVCENDNINFTASGGTSYLWVGPNFYLSSTQNPSIASATPSMNGIYYVNVTDANGCQAQGATAVTVNNLPTATAGSNSPVCAGDVISLSASGGTGFAWTGPNSYSSSSQNPAIGAAIAASAGTYSVTVTDANGCQAIATTAVIVNALPVPVVSNNSPVCAGDAISLSASGGTGYAWAGPNTFSSTTQNPGIASASAAAAGTYSVTITDANGCQAMGMTSVTVNALPTVSAGNNGPLCANNDLDLSASGGTGYAWTGPNAFASTSQNPSIPSASVAASGNYVVTVTDANGCQAQATVAVTVNPVYTINNPQQICGGSSYIINGNTYTTTGTYHDTLTSVSGCDSVVITQISVVSSFMMNNPQALCPGSSYTINGHTYSTAGTYNDTLTSMFGCDSIIMTQITINPVYSMNNPQAICMGGAYTLNGHTYTVAGTYHDTLTTVGGCDSVIVTQLSVNPLPTVTAGSNSPVCEFGSIDLTSGGGATYSWTGPNAYSSNSQNPSIPNATLAMSGTYTVTVTDANGCVNSNMTTVTVQTCVGLQQIANAGKQISIAPNPNTGVFIIQSNEELGTVEIYNGLGQLVLKQISNSRALEINMSEQHAGIYYVRVAGRSLKMVKQ